LIRAAPFIVSSLAALALGTVGGCGNDRPPPPPCVVSGDPEVTLGTGPEDGMGYLPMTDGQTVSLTFGVQNGFHVWTNVRARNMCFAGIKVKRTATLVATGQLFSNSQDQLTLVPATDPQLAAQGWGELPDSRPTFMCPNQTGMDLPGQMVRMDVTVTDSKGHVATDHHVIIPQCPSNSFYASCLVQCSPPPLDGGVD
jgi:hypothetical protein